MSRVSAGSVTRVSAVSSFRVDVGVSHKYTM